MTQTTLASAVAAFLSAGKSITACPPRVATGGATVQLSDTSRRALRAEQVAHHSCCA